MLTTDAIGDDFVHVNIRGIRAANYKKMVMLIRWVCCSGKSITFAIPISDARVAELVDALVSNTSEVTLVPVRPRPRVQKNCSWNHGQFLYSPLEIPDHE
jgi:hypothetical protein